MPPPVRGVTVVAVPDVDAVTAASPAFVDTIGDAAQKLSEEINWNSYACLLKPENASVTGPR